LEVLIVSEKHLDTLLTGLARVIRSRVIEPVRRHACSRRGERELARLDDHLLSDIGLTRSQIHAAAYGLFRLGAYSFVHSTRASPAEAAGARLKRRSTVPSVGGAMPAPLAERAARG
jgi:uncharacterized protein YjiS (DUF1127 family)